MKKTKKATYRPNGLSKGLLYGFVLGLALLWVATRLTIVPQRKACFIAPDFSRKTCVVVAVADTERERTRGLSGKRFMAENAGMLFDFGEPSQHRMWMKEMKFGLDFIWVKGNEVIEVTPNVGRPKNPTDELLVYQSNQTIDAVVEVNAGWVKTHGLETGWIFVLE